MRKHLVVGATAIAALTAGIAIPASAASPAVTSASSNYNPVTPVRVIDTRQTHQTLGAKGTLKVQIAGTHGVPADATAVAVNITDAAPTVGGFLTAYPDGAARPSASTLNFGKGQVVANEVHVQLGADGAIDLFNLAGRTDAVVDLEGFYTGAAPAAPACTSTVSSIPAAPVTLHNVGGSIRTGATDAGSVHLAAGTYDARVLGNFTGLNNTDDTAFAGKQVYGTMVLVIGDAINTDFSNDITDGGHLIPQAASQTLTIDPTTQLSTFVTIPAGGSDVHVMFFAYDDDSSSTGTTGQPGADAIHAAIQSAQFRNVC